MSSQHFDITGDGPAIIMLHGWGQTRVSMEPLARALSARFRVINMDLPGHGAAKDMAGPFTFARYMEDISAAAKAQADGPFHLLGWSMGGSIAARYVLEEVEPKPRSLLALTAPARFIGPKGSGMGQNLASIERLIAQLRFDHVYALKTFIEFFFVSGEAVDPALVAPIREALLPPATFPPAKDALIETLEELKALDLTLHPAAPRQAAGLLISGTLDRICPGGGQTLWDEVFVNLEKLPLADCGHAPHLTRLEETSAAITDFLDRLQG